MSRKLDRIVSKVTRAKQHIQDFQLGLRAFNDTVPYAASYKEDTKIGKRIYYVSKADPVPDQLTAIAADVIQNLRSPLDQIAYQIVLDARGGKKPDWNVYYPICRSATDYLSALNRNIKGVRQEVIDAINATEPYERGKGHALWQLNEMNKTDKHQLLFSGATFHRGVDISGDINGMIRRQLESTEIRNLPNLPDIKDMMFPPLYLTPSDKLLNLEVGDELWSEPLDKEMYKDRRFSFDVSFDMPGVIECEPALKTLQDMANLVDEIIPRLGQFLP